MPDQHSVPTADSDGHDVLLTIPVAAVSTLGWPRADVHLVQLNTEDATALAGQLHDAVATVEAEQEYRRHGDTDADPAEHAVALPLWDAPWPTPDRTGEPT